MRGIVTRRPEPGGVAEWVALHLAVAQSPTPTPCSRDPESWFAETPAQRAEAAARCAGCQVFTACGTYADAAQEHYGVWSGRDRTRPASKRAAA